jgi:hypothetical protein
MKSLSTKNKTAWEKSYPGMKKKGFVFFALCFVFAIGAFFATVPHTGAVNDSIQFSIPPPEPASGIFCRPFEPAPMAPAVLTAEAGGSFREFSTVLSNRPIRNSVNIIITGDGYTLSDLQPGSTFDVHASQFMRALANEEPFKSYHHFLNIHLIRAVSQERGADSHQDRDERDTIFDATYGAYGIDRLLIIRRPEKLQNLIRLAPKQDIVVILVNDTRYGGSGYMLQTAGGTIPAPIYAAGHPSGIRIAFHELGHSLANLADEYVDESIARHYSLSLARDKPNIDTTNNLENIKWSYFFRIDPNAFRVLGAFEGAYYRAAGVFRPQENCLMRSLSHPFCHVCRKEVSRALFRIANFIFDEEAYHRENPVRIP